MKRFLIGLPFLLVLLMVISYFLSQSKLKELTPEIRATLGGESIELEDGVISYYWRGPEDGEVVVLVHGLSTPKFVWNGNVDALALEGYRVLAFDHYGRGFSDRPETKYDSDFYIREILNLLKGLSITEPVTFVGYSMGGGNVISFSAKYPERVKKIIQIAPAGFIPKYSGTAALVLIPVIGDYFMAIMGKEAMLSDIRREVESGNAPADMVELFEEQFKYKGYLPAILSTMRHYPLYNLSKEYETVGKSGIPVYAIWGTDDQVVPFEGSEKVKKAIPHVKIFPVSGANHSVTYARAEEVNRLMLKALEDS